MSSRLIDWIWHVRGRVPLPPQQSGDEAFARLKPLFSTAGTSHDRVGDNLTFRKRGQTAQDKMSIFDRGALWIEHGASGPLLRYHLVSRALLFCFLAPLLFLAFAQFTVFVGTLEKPPTAAEKAAAEAKKQAAEQQKAKMPMNPVDIFLGAPAPDKPEKKDAKKKPEEEKKKHSPTPAYVFAGLFVALYLIGRVLEEWLVKRLFRRRLHGLSLDLPTASGQAAASGGSAESPLILEGKA